MANDTQPGFEPKLSAPGVAIPKYNSKARERGKMQKNERRKEGNVEQRGETKRKKINRERELLTSLLSASCLSVLVLFFMD